MSTITNPVPSALTVPEPATPGDLPVDLGAEATLAQPRGDGDEPGAAPGAPALRELVVGDNAFGAAAAAELKAACAARGAKAMAGPFDEL